MVDYYASTAIPDGDVAAGTEGEPTSIRDAIAKAGAGDVIYFRDAGSAWIIDDGSGPLESAVADATPGTPIRVVGYETTIGDGGMPEIEDISGMPTIVLNDTNYFQWSNVTLTGGSRAIRNVSSTTRGVSYTRCWIRNQTFACVNTAGHANEPFVFIGCVFQNSPIGLWIGGRDAVVVGCLSVNCSTAGYQVANNNKGAKIIRCVAYNCGTGFLLGNHEAWFDQSIAHACTTGVQIGAPGRYVLTNCGITACTTGLQGGTGGLVQLWHCGTFDNATDTASLTIEHDVGRVTGDPLYLDGSPASDLDVNLHVAAGSPWLEAGMGVADFISPMGAPDIGLPQTAQPGENTVTEVDVLVPLAVRMRGI